MVRPGGPEPTLPPTGERADEYRGLGIQGQTQRVRGPGGLLVDLAQLLKDGIGLLQLFWGLHLVTGRSRNPNRFSLVVIVWIDGSCFVGIALAVDQLLADLRGGHPAIQACGLEGRVGLEVVVDEVADVVQEVGQVDLDGLASPGGEVVEAGDAGVEFMQSLAHGIACPAQVDGRLPLTEVEGLDRLGHEPSASGTVEGIRGLHQPRTHRRTQSHSATSCVREVGIVQNSSGRIIFLNPPKATSTGNPRGPCTQRLMPPDEGQSPEARRIARSTSGHTTRGRGFIA